jgi:putative membrane protein
MNSKLLRCTGFATAAMLMVWLGACKPRENAGTTSGSVDHSTAADTGTANATVADSTGQNGERLADVNIVALLDEANAADSAAGAVAFKKATNPEVKAFATLMMGEHHALRAEGQKLAKRLNLTPQPPPNDPVQPMAKEETTVLQSTPKGPEFDRVYIQHEVAAHKAVLDLAKKAHDQAQNEELKKLIEQAQPTIEKHLRMAEDIQKKLGEPSA